MEEVLGVPSRQNFIPIAVISLSLAAIAIGWAGPYRPSSALREATRGRDVLIALDVSKSMLARDVGPDRLTAARAFIASLAEQLGEDRIGLILFAGHAYLQLPLTSDRGALLTLLPTIHPEAVPTGGTALAEALSLSTQAFPEKVPSGRILVIVSDGEDHGGGVPDAAAKAVEEGGVTIHAVGIGSPEGTTLFDPATGAPRTTEDGTPVVSKLDEEGLRSIAKLGRGIYVRMGSPEGASRQLAAAISKTQGSARTGGGAIEADHLFYFALLPAFLLLLWDTARFRRKISRSVVAVTCVLIMLPNFSHGQDRYLRKGNEHYRAGRYREAGEAYSRALTADSANPKGRFNQGAALYQQKSYDAARNSLSAAAMLARDGATKGAALYNVGNTYGAENKWKEAADAYRKALRSRPADGDAQYNLSYALAKLRAQQEQQKKQQEKKQQNSSDQKKNQPSQPQQDKKDAPRKPTPGAMSEEGAERILSALRDEEKRVREREQKEKGGASESPQKDW